MRIIKKILNENFIMSVFLGGKHPMELKVYFLTEFYYVKYNPLDFDHEIVIYNKAKL